HVGSMQLTVVGTTIYASSPDGVYALAASDGARRWTFPLEVVDQGGAPVAADGPVYAPAGDSLYALDSSTGMVRWKALSGAYLGDLQFTNSSLSAPGVGSAVVAVSSSDGNTYAFNATDGSLRWKFSVASHSAAPVIANGLVFVAGNNSAGTVYAITL